VKFSGRIDFIRYRVRRIVSTVGCETGQPVIPAGHEMPQYFCGPLPTSLSLRKDRLSEE
jgi:hypothetical protein